MTGFLTIVLGPLGLGAYLLVRLRWSVPARISEAEVEGVPDIK